MAHVTEHWDWYNRWYHDHMVHIFIMHIELKQSQTKNILKYNHSINIRGKTEEAVS